MMATRRRVKRTRTARTAADEILADAGMDEQCADSIARDDARDAKKKLPALGSLPSLPDVPSYAGTTIRVTYGAEKFSPIQFHTFDVGGGFIDVQIRPGETPLDAWRRGYDILRQMTAAEFKAKLPDYAKRVTEADAFVRRHASKS